MKVVIAEKPSLGRTIASAFGHSEKHDGYLQNRGLIVTWAFGHLMELKDMDDYFDHPVKWGEELPFFPASFKYRLKKGKDVDHEGIKRQFNTIKYLINNDRVDEIICAGDADREGEVIVRLILKFALKSNKKITRLWLPDQTPKTIQLEMKQRKNDSEYDNLYNEGIARQYIDWLLGINLTRSVTVKSGAHGVLNIGRVICPIVMEIYNRDKTISDFVPEKYWAVLSDLNGIKLTAKETFPFADYQKAEAVCQDLNSVPAVVKDINTKDIIKKSPHLFSLSKLQGYCGKHFKLSPSETLKIVQTLYEAGLVTYPRTNTEYLAENEKGKIKHILDKWNDERLVFKDNKYIFDDSKIESHSALTPTEKDVSDGLSRNERLVYDTIKNRFMAVFCREECIQSKTTAVISVGYQYKQDIKINGVVQKKEGWLIFENTKTADKILPSLIAGQTVPVDFKKTEKTTTPPKHYTVETLGNWMTHPFKKETDTEDDEYKALLEGCEIGTEATRAGIIDKACKVEYISLKNNVYHIEPKGKYMVEFLKTVGLDMSPARTVEMQKMLKRVYKGQNTVDDAIDDTKSFLSTYFSKIDDINVESYIAKENMPVGKCPWCGNDLYRYKGKYGIFYSHNKHDRENCSFSLKAHQKYYGQDMNLTDAKVKQMLEGKGAVIQLKSKKNESYKVRMFLENDADEYNGRLFPKFRKEFYNSRKKR